MNMQHDFGDWRDKVSMKGIMLLEQDAIQRENRRQCIRAAGKLVADATPSDSAWLILQTHFGRESAVEKDLGENEIDACVPVCKGPQRRRHHKVLPPSEKPVFTGYVFVRCVPTGHALRALAQFDHVRDVVGGWERPHRLTNERVMHFKAMAESGAYDWEAPGSAFKVGARVLVKEGPFYSFEGTVVAFGGSGKGTPVVELEVFGRKTPILIPLAMLMGV